MKRWYLFYGILAALLGLLIIIFPTFWIRLVVFIIGLAAIAYGIYCLKFTKDVYEDFYYKRTLFIKSIVSIIAGVMAVLFPLAIGGAAWEAMIWVLIIYLLVSAAIGFYAAALLKDSGIERRRYIIENLLLLAVALVLILISPRSLGTAIIRLLGIITLAAGIIFIIFDLVATKNEVKAEVVEVNDEKPENHDGDAAVDTSANDNDL